MSKEQLLELSKQGGETNRVNASEHFAKQLSEAGFDNNYKPNKEESKKYNFKRYYGKVCKKHPKLNGVRLVSNSSCVQCLNQSKEVKRKNTLVLIEEGAK